MSTTLIRIKVFQIAKEGVKGKNLTTLTRGRGGSYEKNPLYAPKKDNNKSNDPVSVQDLPVVVEGEDGVPRVPRHVDQLAPLQNLPQMSSSSWRKLRNQLSAYFYFISIH